MYGGLIMKYCGDTVDQALSRGLADLNVGRDQVEVRVVSQGRRGFLGIGKKPAEVEIKVLTPDDQIDDEYTNKLETEITTEVKESEGDYTTETVTESKETSNSDEKDVKAVNEEQLEKALHTVGDYLCEIIEQLGIDAEISVTVNNRYVYYDFDTDQQGLLIGKHGKTINALQILAQAFFDKQIKQRYRVILDVGDYREHRREELQRISKELAERALIERRAFKLGPMPAMERKVVHKTLAANHHIRAKSHGNDPYRYIVIAPKLH